MRTDTGAAVSNRHVLHTSLLAVLSLATLIFSSCGSGSQPHPCGANSDACIAQRFIYATATATANEVLVFPVTQMGGLGTPSSVPGPAFIVDGGTMAVSRNTGELFVADHVLKTVSAFLIDPNGHYSPIAGSPYAASGIGFLGGLAATPDGKFLYVVGESGGVSGFSIAINGSLSPVPGSPVSVTAGSVDALVEASSRFLFVTSGSSVSVFSINSTNGSLTSMSMPVPLPGLSLPTPGMAAASNSSFLFVALRGSNSVAAFSFDANTGGLTPVTGSPFPVGTGPVNVITTAKTLYVTNSVDGTISAFTWDKNTGALTAIGGSPFTAPWGAGLTSINDEYLYVASVNNVFPPFVNAILAYHIDPFGAITALPGSPYLAKAQLWGGMASF